MGITSAMFGLTRRDHPSNPSEWLLYGLTGAGSQTYTGKRVNEEEALSSTAVWAAVRTISETTASLPLHLYKRLPKGGKDRATEHYLYNLLHLKPNSEMTAMVFREAQMGQILRYGYSCAEKELDNSGKVIALWPLLSKDITPRRINGQLLYEVILPSGSIAIVPKERMLYIPGFSSNGISAYNPITRTKEAISLNLALEEYASRYFGNGAKPAAVIEIPGSLGPKGLENFKASWKESQEGLGNAHRMAILEEGIKIHEYGADPQESQAIESRKFSVVEIARIFNVPPHMLKDLERATFSNIEEQSLEFVIYTLRPWLVRLEQNYTVQLLSEVEQREYFFEHLIDGLLRGDSKTRWESYMTGFQCGAFSPNNILEMENKNPFEGGDEHFIQVNMMPLSQAGEIFQQKANPQEPTNEEVEEEKAIPTYYEKRSMTGVLRLRETFRPLFEDAIQRVVSKETLAVKRAVEKNFTQPQRDEASFDRWLIDFYNTMPEYIIKAASPHYQAYASEVYRQVSLLFGDEAEITDDIVKFVKDYTAVFAERYAAASIAQLKAIVRDNVPETWVTLLNERLDDWNVKRAAKVSSDEIVRGANAVLHESYKSFGVKKLKWMARGDSCPFCNSMNGKTIGIEKTFLDEGDVIYSGPDKKVSFKKPGASDYLTEDEFFANRATPGSGWTALKIEGSKKHPPIHRGCDCIIVPVFS